MERASIDMKTPTAKCPEKNVLWSKGVQKTVIRIHEKSYDVYIAKLHVMQVF